MGIRCESRQDDKVGQVKKSEEVINEDGDISFAEVAGEWEEVGN